MSLKKDQGEKTKKRLIQHAHKMFSERGFGKTRFDEVAKAEGLTTGAMYHHFKNKKELFESVFSKCSKEVSKKVSSESDRYDELSQKLIEGCMIYIETVIESNYKKIMLEDAISTLGWKRWKEIDDQTSELTLNDAIVEGQKSGQIHNFLPSRIISRFISGGVNEISLLLSEKEISHSTLKEARTVIELIINSIIKEEKC